MVEASYVRKGYFNEEKEVRREDCNSVKKRTVLWHRGKNYFGTGGGRLPVFDLISGPLHRNSSAGNYIKETEES
jgi:hypothetical protein